MHPATAQRAHALAARSAWREALIGARRQPTHRVDVQFRHPPSARGALRLATRVRDALGQMAGCSVEHFAVAERNAGRPGHHLHLVYWTPDNLIPSALKQRWERRAASVGLVTLWTRDDAATGAERTDGLVPVADGVEYVTKHLHREETEWAASPRLLSRIGAPSPDFYP